MATHQIRDNGSAYEKWEIRNGAPLGYVAEKLRHALEDMHSLARSLRQYVPTDAENPCAPSGLPFSVRDDCLISAADAAFHYALVAFLALHNRLALADEPQIEERLLRKSGSGFSAWVKEIERRSTLYT